MKLLENQTTDANSDWVSHRGGEATVFVYGTWDGAQIEIELSPDQTTAISDTELTFTADNVKVFRISQGVSYRAKQTSSGASTSLSVDVL